MGLEGIQPGGSGSGALMSNFLMAQCIDGLRLDNAVCEFRIHSVEVLLVESDQIVYACFLGSIGDDPIINSAPLYVQAFHPL